MTKAKIKRTVLIIATVIWMGIIFSFSAEPAEESTNTSDIVIDKICTVVVRDYKSLDNVSRQEVIGNYSFLVRKCAHFTAYLMLGGLVCSTFAAFEVRGKKRFLLSLSVCALYALSDEIHQYFVPGRACRLLDVLIDSAGAAVGAGIVCFAVFLITRKRLIQSHQGG